ncbi:MAG: SLC13 family permease [Alphaproteobacteria bacterium]|nr:SLC13 family permease [Alphaproteobacteria bacterium]
MTVDQFATLSLLAAVVVLFIWGRWRVDAVAMLALMAAFCVGLVPSETVFSGFGHPAVITVAAVLALSSALARSGVVDLIAAWIERFAATRFTQLVALSTLGGAMSGFMNNVGALALLMPVALSMAKRTGYSASLVLMPLSFATILGGLVTLIGTPPNVIIAQYHEQMTGHGFQLFDFAWTGIPMAVAGILFLTLVGWRLLPSSGQNRSEGDAPFDIDGYVTELVVPQGAKVVGKTIDDIAEEMETPPQFDGIVRGRTRVIRRLHRAQLQEGDVLLVHGDTESIEELVSKGFKMVAAKDLKAEEGGSPIDTDALAVVEAVVTPRSWLEGRTPALVALRARYGINLLAIARSGAPIRSRLRDARFQAGDVLLLQGARDQINETVRALGCLPLAYRNLSLEPRRALVPVLLFAAAIAATVTNVLPAAVALTFAVVLLVFLRGISVREVYEAIDWQVIVLLAAMIPVGGALETTGTANLLANAIASAAWTTNPHVILAIVLILTMTLSDIMNNAATAVVMAPVSVGLASAIGVSPDPMLMAVAVGASSAFLTPIGHQNNLLVMGPGGYRFGDYWRMGLPLEIILVGLGVLIIPWVWPFT